MTERPNVLAPVSDLMLAERLAMAAEAVGCSLQVVDDPAALKEHLGQSIPNLVVIDLADRAFPGEATLKLIQAQNPRPTVLACYPHVRKDLERIAQEAGCDLLMPRSRFLLDLPGALRLGLSA